MPNMPMILRDSRGREICERCRVADKPHARLRGLLGRDDLPAGEGLLLRPAPSIHTWFMRFPIDVVFLDAQMRVLDVIPGMRPWRMAGRRKARTVVELAAGEAGRRGVRVGDLLELIPTAGM